MEPITDQFNYYGELELLNQQKTTFFCPYDVTDDIFHTLREWVGRLDPMAGVIVCGNSTGIERFVLRLLLRKGFAVIVPLATTIPTDLSELNLGQKLTGSETLCLLDQAFADHRLLLVSSAENVSVSVPTRKTLLSRDAWMCEHGTRFVVAIRREFDYFDQLLVGRSVTYLSQPMPEEGSETEEVTTARRQRAIRMGWTIYRRLKSHVDSAEELNALVSRYMQLGLEHPSLLHSLVLQTVALNYADFSDFDFQAFLRSWSIQNLRPEDWVAYRCRDGKELPSLVDRCLTRLFRQMPSRRLMSLDYSRPFDSALVHEWLDAVLLRSPNNPYHVKRALRLAYYEHDREKINYYSQQLAV